MVFLAGNFAGHLLALALALFALLAVAGAPRWVVAFAALTVLGFATYSWMHRPRMLPMRSGADHERIRLLSANLNWRAESHAAALARLSDAGGDIVVLQEVTADTHARLDRYFPDLPHRIGAGHSHVMVLSRWPLRPAPVPELPGAAGRAVEVEVGHPRLPVRVLALHLQVPRTPANLTVRLDQLTRLARHLDDAGPGPLLVVGDLNATPWSRSLARVIASARLCSAAPPLPRLATWPAAFGFLGLHLDQVLARGPLARGRADTHRLPGSDHRALGVDLFPLR